MFTDAEADATLPDRICLNWRASFSSNKDVPPRLNEDILISSALKFVDFRITRTPLFRVRMVDSKGPFSVFMTLPPLGVSFIRGSFETLSTYASSFSAFTSASTFLISASVGSFTPGLSGQNRLTTVLLSVTNDFSSWFTLSNGILGTICVISAYSSSMLGIGSPLMKLDTYWLTNCSLFILLRSLYTFSSARK